jgi:hypothetical protein
MSTAQKTTFTVKVIGGSLKTVKAIDIRDAALKAIGKRTTSKCYGVWFDASTSIAQVTHRTKHGVMIISAVAIYNGI